MRNRCVLTRVYFSTPNRLERFRYNFNTYTNKLVLLVQFSFCTSGSWYCKWVGYISIMMTNAGEKIWGSVFLSVFLNFFLKWWVKLVPSFKLGYFPDTTKLPAFRVLFFHHAFLDAKIHLGSCCTCRYKWRAREREWSFNRVVATYVWKVRGCIPWHVQSRRQWNWGNLSISPYTSESMFCKVSLNLFSIGFWFSPHTSPGSVATLNTTWLVTQHWYVALQLAAVVTQLKHLV